MMAVELAHLLKQCALGVCINWSTTDFSWQVPSILFLLIFFEGKCYVAYGALST